MSNNTESFTSEVPGTPKPNSALLNDGHALITISGPPGCGATTVARELADALNYDYVNGGQMFRDLADERGLTLNELLEQAGSDDTLDRSLDARIQRIIDQHSFTTTGLVIESRLAGWVAGDDADFKLWLDAPRDIRIERTKYRSDEDLELRERESNEIARYEQYYGIDLRNTRFYDLHINTARWAPEPIVDMVMTSLENYVPQYDEGTFEQSFNPRPADD